MSEVFGLFQKQQWFGGNNGAMFVKFLGIVISSNSILRTTVNSHFVTHSSARIIYLPISFQRKALEDVFHQNNGPKQDIEDKTAWRPRNNSGSTWGRPAGTWDWWDTCHLCLSGPIVFLKSQKEHKGCSYCTIFVVTTQCCCSVQKQLQTTHKWIWLLTLGSGRSSFICTARLCVESYLNDGDAYNQAMS